LLSKQDIHHQVSFQIIYLKVNALIFLHENLLAKKGNLNSFKKKKKKIIVKNMKKKIFF
jgi:hypothetical protein